VRSFRLLLSASVLVDAIIPSSLLLHLHPIQFSPGSDLAVFLQISFRVSASSLAKLPVEILTDCSVFV